FQSASLTPMISAREYVGFAVTMCLAFGGTFQLPIVILALTMLGLVTPASLGKFRKHAAVGSFIVASVITPGDLIIMTLWLGVPLYGLYEVSIVLSWIVHRARQRRARAGDATIGKAKA
ncbi:MAG: twin-arginine translocase subunit TatC, partial [Gemmatimonas sp.]|nr:twin-arginine translocase subunit TatC [Gemmatimonas sp.]